MDRQFRVTDDVCEHHMRYFELNFLFNLGSHMDSLEIPLATILSSRMPRVEREAGHSRNRWASQGCLDHLHSICLFFPVYCSRSSTDITRFSSSYIVSLSIVR